MVLWILLLSAVLFAITFIGFVKKPFLRYPFSLFFLLIAGACSVSLMLNDAQHLGMTKTTKSQTQTLVSTAGRKKPFNVTVYQPLGNGSEKIFIYRTASQPNRNQKTKINQNVTIKVKHTNTSKPELVVQQRQYTYQNGFWKFMFMGLGLNKETHHYNYIFKVPQNWLVLSTYQLRKLQKQEPIIQKQIDNQIKNQLPAIVQRKMAQAMAAHPAMTEQQKVQLEKQITEQQKKRLIAQVKRQIMVKLLPQLQKESL